MMGFVTSWVTESVERKPARALVLNCGMCSAVARLAREEGSARLSFDVLRAAAQAPFRLNTSHFFAGILAPAPARTRVDDAEVVVVGGAGASCSRGGSKERARR